MGHEQPPRPVAPHQEEQQQEQEQEQPAPGAVRPLEEVVKTMGIRPAFQAWLLRQARAGDEFIEAALELYEVGGHDTCLLLTRLVCCDHPLHLHSPI